MSEYAQEEPTGKRKLPIQFKFESIQNEELSIKKGRPIYENKPFVYIFIPGNKDVVVREIRKNGFGQYDDQTVKENPVYWNNFINGRPNELTDGTPLTEWPHPSMTQEKVLSLASSKITTVEHLAAVPDSGLFKIGVKEGRELRDAAIGYLKRAPEMAGMLEDKRKIKESESRIADSEAQIKELRASLAAAMAKFEALEKPAAKPSKPTGTWGAPKPTNAPTEENKET